MRIIRPNKLNAHSQKALVYLKEYHPDLLKFFLKDSCSMDFWILEFQPPNKNISGHLVFDSDEERFTLAFASYHCHFFTLAEMDFFAELEFCVATIRKIMDNRLVVAQEYRKNEMSDSYLLNHNELREITLTMSDERNWDRIEITSWDGSFDHTI